MKDEGNRRKMFLMVDEFTSKVYGVYYDIV